MGRTLMGDHSSVEVDDAVKNTVKSQERRIRPPMHAPGTTRRKKIRCTKLKKRIYKAYLELYSSLRHRSHSPSSRQWSPSLTDRNRFSCDGCCCSRRPPTCCCAAAVWRTAGETAVSSVPTRRHSRTGCDRGRNCQNRRRWHRRRPSKKPRPMPSADDQCPCRTASPDQNSTMGRDGHCRRRCPSSVPGQGCCSTRQRMRLSTRRRRRS